MNDEFFELAFRVWMAVFHKAADVGDFRPKDEAIAVGEFVDVRVMLIMGEANRVGAHFLDDGEIELMVFFA